MVRLKPTISLLAVLFGATSTSAQDLSAQNPGAPRQDAQLVQAEAQQTDPAALHQELERSRQLVFSLESPINHHDPRLAEPLLQMADQLMRLGNYGEAHATLDRGMQIVRINEGLYTRGQLPFLRKKIENYANAGDWESARDQLQHLFWLYRTKSKVIDTELIDDLLNLSSMHLRGVAEDNLDYQSYHLRRSASANWLALAAGESLWGKTDERLVPVLYSLVKNYHLQAAAVERGGRVAYELRQITPGSDMVRERIDARHFYYFTGLRLLKQLRSIYENAESPNPESVAMSNLYLADWQTMFSRNGEAMASYKLAYEGLEQAGVEEGLMQAYFSQPTLLPAADFYPRLMTAMEQRSAEQKQPAQLASAAAETLYFNEWSASFPYVRKPSQLASRQSLDSNIALFSFNLAGVTEITHWINGRRELEFASIQEARIVQPALESEDQQEELLKRLDYLRFRPRLDAGVPRDATTTLMYQIASDHR